MDKDDAARPASTKVRARFGFWPYVAAAALSWYGFQQAGIHPALGLLQLFQPCHMQIRHLACLVLKNFIKMTCLMMLTWSESTC